MQPYHKTKHGQIVVGDSLDYMAGLKPQSVDLIVTSPPFGLVRKKDYGNVESHEYVDWFKPFGQRIQTVSEADRLSCHRYRRRWDSRTAYTIPISL